MIQDPLYIDTQAMLTNSSGSEAVGIATDVVMHIWWPTKQPFEYNAKHLANRLHELLPARGYSEKLIARNHDALKSFFTELPDGRWVPSPVYFSLSNGNPGSAS